ncbi:MAG: aminoacyl-tRNA hydrolase [Trueperaceae bacterium]|nr:aminoacyl-tRNA hydrolase [Trueperaceae bacterium]
MYLIAGLGNPGPRFTGTRHNAGFLVVDELAARWGGKFRRIGASEVLRVGHKGAMLIKPQTFMNLSGGAVQAALSKERAPLDDLLVIHDDVDLPLGRLRFKQGGGAGGQKGVKDVIDRLGPDFLRLKIGVGRPPDGRGTDNWVLGRFAPEERQVLADVIAEAADAVETLLTLDLETAMNRANGIDLAADSKGILD